MEFNIKQYINGNALVVIRRNMVSVLSGVVAVAAVVACYYPVSGWYTDLQARVAKRAAIAGTVNGLLTTTRTLPTLYPNQPPIPLPGFPTDAAIRQATDMMAKVKDQSTGMLTTAVTLNTHQPLDPDALLANASQEALAQFVHDYRIAVLDDSRIRNWPPPDIAMAARQRNINLVSLKSCRRPTPDDITQALAQLKQEIDGSTLVHSITDQSVTPESQEQATEAYTDKSRTRPMEIAFDRAQHGKVYLEPGAIKVADAYTRLIAAAAAPARSDIWDAQRILWIDEDVANGVAFANARARDVLDSPVKQIDNVSMDNPWVINPQNSTAAEDQPLPVAYDASPTGRITNGLYEVLHFSVELDVDARQVAHVLAALEHDQYITVIGVQASSKDTTDLLMQRFIYGPAPIVDLKISCEELMLRQWFNNYEPAVAASSGTAQAPQPGATPDSP